MDQEERQSASLHQLQMLQQQQRQQIEFARQRRQLLSRQSNRATTGSLPATNHEQSPSNDTTMEDERSLTASEFQVESYYSLPMSRRWIASSGDGGQPSSNNHFAPLNFGHSFGNSATSLQSTLPPSDVGFENSTAEQVSLPWSSLLGASASGATPLGSSSSNWQSSGPGLDTLYDNFQEPFDFGDWHESGQSFLLNSSSSQPFDPGSVMHMSGLHQSSQSMLGPSSFSHANAPNGQNYRSLSSVLPSPRRRRASRRISQLSSTLAVPPNTAHSPQTDSRDTDLLASSQSTAIDSAPCQLGKGKARRVATSSTAPPLRVALEHVLQNNPGPSSSSVAHGGAEVEPFHRRRRIGPLTSYIEPAPKTQKGPRPSQQPQQRSGENSLVPALPPSIESPLLADTQYHGPSRFPNLASLNPFCSSEGSSLNAPHLWDDDMPQASSGSSMHNWDLEPENDSHLSLAPPLEPTARKRPNDAAHYPNNAQSPLPGREGLAAKDTNTFSLAVSSNGNCDIPGSCRELLTSGAAAIILCLETESFLSDNKRHFDQPPSEPSIPFESETATSPRRLTRDSSKPRATPTAAFLYQTEAPASGSDVWPDIRNQSKLPVRYLPLRVVTNDSKSWLIETPASKQRSSSRSKPRSNRSMSSKTILDLQCTTSGLQWPEKKIPAELFQSIMSYLCRDDIKAMRLVCKEFEHFTSHALFETVVVPFNTEIYGMLGEVRKKKPDRKGKGKAIEPIVEHGSLYWNNANEDDVYTGHGLDVFRGFGPHIQKYGMSFEVDEDALANPPNKKLREGHTSFWGDYEWPYQHYRRFDRVANLEDAADETPRMKTAFSYLTQVKELALSIDSGLGWLSGPDLSIRARVFRRPSKVFRNLRAIPDRKTQAQKTFWSHLVECHRPDLESLKHATLHTEPVSFSPSSFNEVARHTYGIGSHAPPGQLSSGESCSEVRHLLGSSLPLVDSQRLSRQGILFATTDESIRHPSYSSIVPNRLTTPQKEWLMETEWAQRAFLSSYMLAIMDNPVTFQNVHTLNLARISSRYIQSLIRKDFWDSLPSLESVTLQVIADWRTVTKDEAGFVQTSYIEPLCSVGPFQKLLEHCISPRQNIKNLRIGWASGGEHAEGILARNRHILPAPILPEAWLTSEMLSTAPLRKMLRFPHVEHLTFVNCWMTPFALTEIVKSHGKLELIKLTLDSVSLTAVPRLSANANPPAAAGGALNQALPPQQAAMHAQLQQQMATMANVLQQLHAVLPQTSSSRRFSRLGPHRAGSWPYILDIISPGKTLADFGSAHSRHPTSPTSLDPNTTSTAASSRISALEELELFSCGYARLTNLHLDQSALELGDTFPGDYTSPFFSRRCHALLGSMMATADQALGSVVQHIPPQEVEALRLVWGCRMGWEDAWAARGPEFDGCLAGGTGRFSGVVRKGERDEGR